MLEELGRLLTAAFNINRVTAERWAQHIIGGATDEAARELVRAYIRGRQVGYTVHGAALGASRVIPARVARRWRDAGLAWAVDVQQRVLRTFDDRGDVTRAFVQSYANGITTQATWTGNDEMFKDLAVASTVEFKRWVRAWPRTDHRDWHDILEDAKAIPVDDLFTLPGGPNAGSQVYGPRDWNRVGDPAEHMNCGHALAFETAPTVENTEDPRGSVVYDPRDQPRTRAAARFSRPRASEIPLERRADVWSPTKTPEAAEAFVQDSAYREPAYHVTTEANAAAIQREGFRPAGAAGGGFGDILGEGTYLATDNATREFYERIGARSGTPVTLEVRANVRNTLDVSLRRGDEPMTLLYAGDNARGISPFVGTGYTTNPSSLSFQARERLAQIASPTRADQGRIVREVLEANGYDSVRVRLRIPDVSDITDAAQRAEFLRDQMRDRMNSVGGEQLIVFDPRRVVVVRGR